MNNGSVVIVDVDPDDRELLKEAWLELNFPNELIFLSRGDEVLRYLHTGNIPFLILCDVNIPGMDGFELKKKIYDNTALNYQSIPFVFWSTVASQAQVQKAYDLGGNGFFVKENTFEEIKQSLVDITRYWRKSKTPF